MGMYGISIFWWAIGLVVLIVIGIIFWKINNKIQSREFKENFSKKMSSPEIQQSRKKLMRRTKEELIEDYLKLQGGWSLYKP